MKPSWQSRSEVIVTTADGLDSNRPNAVRRSSKDVSDLDKAGVDENDKRENLDRRMKTALGGGAPRLFFERLHQVKIASCLFDDQSVRIAIVV